MIHICVLGMSEMYGVRARPLSSSFSTKDNCFECVILDRATAVKLCKFSLCAFVLFVGVSGCL